MKIMHVSKKYPKALGGDAVVVFNLHKQQESAGHEVVIVTSNCDEVIKAPNVYKFGLKDEVFRLDAITAKRFISLFVLFFRIFPILRKERPKVVHTHSIDMAFAISAAAHFYHIPIVHTFHILTFYDANQMAFRRKIELLLTKAAKLSAVTAPNKFDVNKLKEAGFKQAVFLPNGVDVSFWQPQTKPMASNNKEDVFTFATFGRLEKQKGYDYMIRAASLLAGQAPKQFQIIIAGEGSQAQDLKKLVDELGLNERIIFTGHKKPEEVRDLLANADAAVFPSLYETTPLTLLEAWAAGMPVIASAVGILRDLPVDFNAAYVVPAKDENALAQAMASCMENAKVRAAVAAKGRKEASRYRWPVIARKAESIYGNLL